MAELVHHACGEWGAIFVGVDGDDGVDFSYIPVEVAMDGVGVDDFLVDFGVEGVADFNGLGVDDYGVLAEAADDVVDDFAFFWGAVGHGVAGVDDPWVGMGGEFVEGFGWFADGEDVVGDAHDFCPVFG